VKKLLFLICLFELLIFNFAFSDIHYVSQTGTSEYPYISWETAADSIMQAMRAADPGDTVMVGAGDYYPDTTIVMKDSVSLIGAGMDSTKIYGSPNILNLIILANWSVIKGFHILANGSDLCIWENVAHTPEPVEVIENNRITGGDGLYLGDASTIIRNNIITDANRGISLSFGYDYKISNNTFLQNRYAIYFGPTEARVEITNNVVDGTHKYSFTPLYLVANWDSTLVVNNIIYGGETWGIYCYCYAPVVIRNNTVTYSGSSPLYISGGIFVRADQSVLINNIVTYREGKAFDVDAGSVKLAYNNCWMNGEDYFIQSDSVDSIGNISVDPMFVDSLDFHLQKYSPCVDAGDPDLKDPDSTRSDIGAYGGSMGQSYAYLDLPPKPPDSLEASFDSVAITLSWRGNTEADLSHYVVYKDTLFNFEPDTFKIIGIVSKDTTFFKDFDWELGRTYYYKVSAYDLTGNESSFSEELEITATDVPFTDEIKIDIKKVKLAQNYPNPFNPTTVIYYYLPDIGYQPAEVELTIYNILGSKVRTLVKERQHSGEYRVTWDGKDDEGKDLSSGVYFYRLRVSGIPFVEGKKMVLIR